MHSPAGGSESAFNFEEATSSSRMLASSLVSTGRGPASSSKTWILMLLARSLQYEGPGDPALLVDEGVPIPWIRWVEDGPGRRWSW
jgi:hypothetical protein